MLCAETLEQQMELFLDMSSQSMFGYEPSGEEIVTDEEIDRMVDSSDSVPANLDAEIREGLDEIREEMDKEKTEDGTR